MKQLSKKEKGKWLHFVLDNLILILLMSLVLYAFIDGQFIKKEVKIIEICNGLPVTKETYPQWITNNNTTEVTTWESANGGSNNDSKLSIKE